MMSRRKFITGGALIIVAAAGGLLKRGWSEEGIAKVIGGNFIRVFKAVQV